MQEVFFTFIQRRTETVNHRRWRVTLNLVIVLPHQRLLNLKVSWCVLVLPVVVMMPRYYWHLLVWITFYLMAMGDKQKNHHCFPTIDENIPQTFLCQLSYFEIQFHHACMQITWNKIIYCLYISKVQDVFACRFS